MGAENLTILQIAERIKETLLQEMDLEIPLEIKNIPDKEIIEFLSIKQKTCLGLKLNIRLKIQ